MNYNAQLADSFWSKRVQETDELAAVLNYGLPASINDAFAKVVL